MNIPLKITILPKINYQQVITLNEHFNHNELWINVNKADNYNIPFIVGICSKDTDFYTRMKLFYQELTKEIKFAKLIEKQNNEQKICILTKNKKY